MLDPHFSIIPRFYSSRFYYEKILFGHKKWVFMLFNDWELKNLLSFVILS
jgi:hypothetical protein